MMAIKELERLIMRLIAITPSCLECCIRRRILRVGVLNLAPLRFVSWLPKLHGCFLVGFPLLIFEEVAIPGTFSLIWKRRPL
jgi:hypothetical protein